MNLFYKPSLSELAALIEQTTMKSSNYNVIVDYDGEVLIDSRANLSHDVLGRFKFYFSGMSESNQLGMRTDKYLKFLNQLFKSLMFCWEKDINGRVNYDQISKIQNKLYHKEARELRENAYPVKLSIAS